MSIPRYLCGLSIILIILLQQSRPGVAFAENAFQALDSMVEDVAEGAYVPLDDKLRSSDWFDRFEMMTRQGISGMDNRASTLRQCLATS
jgi:hypothetical protein